MANITINPDKTISIDGKKTFPLMLWSVSNYWDTKTGIVGYTPESAEVSIAKTKNYFTASITSDVPSTSPDKFLSGGMLYTQTPSMITHTNSACFGTLNHQEPDYPGQWYFVSKCPGTTSPPVGNLPCAHTEIGKIYNRKKAESSLPIIQTIMGYYEYSSFKYWQDVCDILNNDTWSYKYPDTHEPNLRERNKIIFHFELENYYNCLWDVNGNMDAITKPCFLGIQAVGIDGFFWLMTPQEIREVCYTAITMGANGLSFWGYKIGLFTTKQYGLVVNSSQFEVYNLQAKELKSINDILCLPTESLRWMKYKSNDVVTMTGEYYTPFSYWGSIQNPSNFNWILKNDTNTGIKYLIVVNKGNQLVTSTIYISSLVGLNKTINLLGNQTSGSGASGRSLFMSNGSFNDTFDSHTVHIYQIGDTPCPQPGCGVGITMV